MEDDTRQRLLDAAEALFAEHGFADTSLRAITARAKANLAAVNYHFGSKDELIRAVFARRLEPLTGERLARLAALEAGGRAVTVEEALAAFIEPSLRLRREGPHGERFTRLLGRGLIEIPDSLRELPRHHYGQLLERFQQILARTLPHLPPGELRWRLRFTLGVLSFTYIAASPRAAEADQIAGGEERLLQQLIRFLSAGLRAPELDADGAAAPDGRFQQVFDPSRGVVEKARHKI